MLGLMLNVEVGCAVLCAPRSLGISVHGVPPYLFPVSKPGVASHASQPDSKRRWDVNQNPNLETRKPRMLRLMLEVEAGRAVLCAPRSLGIDVHRVPALPIPSL
jgi:hypothetical protein